MREMKTADLIGPALDWAVAQVEGVENGMIRPAIINEANKPTLLLNKAEWLTSGVSAKVWAPSTDWSQGGPLIHKYGCDLNCIASANCWESNCWDDDLPTPDLHLMEAETPLIAACRAIVRAKVGRTVQVPDDIA